MTHQREKQKLLPVPDFASREEEVAFWDTHDVTDYFAFDEFVKFEGEVAPSEPVTLHIDVETWEEVQKLAQERDLPPDGLLHVWILERRDAERERRGSESLGAAAMHRPLLPAERVAPASGDDR